MSSNTRKERNVSVHDQRAHFLFDKTNLTPFENNVEFSLPSLLVANLAYKS